jgi:hypothetical protein
MIRMAANSKQKDRLFALKMLLATAGLIYAAIYCSHHPGEFWKILLKAILSPF